MQETNFITDTGIYKRVILAEAPRARKFPWLATASVKDLYVKAGRKTIAFLKVISDLVDAGVEVRLLHAREEG